MDKQYYFLLDHRIDGPVFSGPYNTVEERDEEYARLLKGSQYWFFSSFYLVERNEDGSFSAENLLKGMDPMEIQHYLGMIAYPEEFAEREECEELDDDDEIPF